MRSPAVARLALTGLFLLAFSRVALAELPVDEMQKAIDRGVEYLISQQQPDGSWPHGLMGDPAGANVGCTALCVLALRHARHPKAAEAIGKGTAYVAQQKPEPATYTAGLVEMLLYEDNPSSHGKLINAYAKMTVTAQKQGGLEEGTWGYLLAPWAVVSAPNPPKLPGNPPGRMDHSNMQYAVLALVCAERAGYQVPEITWKRTKLHYEASQCADGGWGYLAANQLTPPGKQPAKPTVSMTAASTVSLFLADEALLSREHRQCKMVPENPAVERGAAWLGKNPMTGAPYAWYAIERLGILTGRSEFGGKDWMGEGTAELLKGGWKNDVPNTAFVVLFLARALEPLIINKLKRDGDWNNDPYDVKHLTEYIGTKFQYPKQWRIVTLDATVDDLLRSPILYISGHEALEFTPGEKAKLKEYVDRGGTILAVSCCAKKPFDESLRKLAAELWPDSAFEPLPKTHPIYLTPRPLATPPALEGLALKGSGRLGIIYSPTDLCCRWHQGGGRATSVFDVGANTYFYIATFGVKLGGIKEGVRRDTTRGGTPAPAKPEPAPPAP